MSLDLAVGNVTTVDPSRTFWDKVVICMACADGGTAVAS
jgi:hypothetical protein